MRVVLGAGDRFGNQVDHDPWCAGDGNCKQCKYNQECGHPDNEFNVSQWRTALEAAEAEVGRANNLLLRVHHAMLNGDAYSMQQVVREHLRAALKAGDPA